MIEALEKLLADGKDSAELRFGLGNAYLGQQEAAAAEKHLQACVDQKPSYTAAWKLLAKAQQQQEKLEQALNSYQTGIEVAVEQGDKQAEKEMQVFIKRLRKQL
ncbi:MAG: hypothetical protein OQK12_09720 [Motiliproteus sp.]|nr:hypothetical protein [Motiliproteus sp.]MCW9053438.1 hypothetical protein [Motiliproteus sp.]